MNPEATPRTNVVDRNHFAWLSYSALGYFAPSIKGKGRVEPHVSGDLFNASRSEEIDESFGRPYGRLIKAAVVGGSEQPIRLGWAWLAGTLTVDGKPVTQYCVPLISLPMVRKVSSARKEKRAAKEFERSGELFYYELAGFERGGDPEITSLVQGSLDRVRLFQAAEYGRGKLFDRFDENERLRPVDPQVFDQTPELMAWCHSVADAAGLPIAEVLTPHGAIPTHRRHDDGIALIMGCGLYLSTDLNP